MYRELSDATVGKNDNTEGGCAITNNRLKIVACSGITSVAHICSSLTFVHQYLYCIGLHSQ